MDNHGARSRCPYCDRPLPAADAGRCHGCGRAVDTPDDHNSPPPFLSIPQMRYQNAYVWLVLVSALDILLTMVVLYGWNGYEVNPITGAIIEVWGFVWAIIFKFATVVLVVIICEVIGRHDDRTGKTLAVCAVVINTLPVAYTFALLLGAEPPATQCPQP